MENDFHYYAFISYSHQDKKWAEWIMKRLTFYRLPSYARKELGKDIKLQPIFKDDHSLPPGPLRELLRMKLRESRFLIVICSPHSAKPNLKNEHWVDEEVSYFKSLGREEYIIPVIVAGKPDGGDEECFCPALGKHIRALDATKEPRKKVLDFIAAKLLRLNPEILHDYVKKERDRDCRIRLLMASPLLLLAILAAAFLIDANRLVVRRYGDYVDSYGLPQGIYLMTDEEVSRCSRHYAFEYKGYRWGSSIHADSSGGSIFGIFGFHRVLQRVVQANSAGKAIKTDHTELANRPEIQTFQYRKNGGYWQLREIQYRKPNGLAGDGPLQKRLLFSDEENTRNGLVRFAAQENSSRILHFANASVTENSGAGIASEHSSITQHLIKRDAAGHPVELRFCNASGSFTPDAEGIFGCRYLLDEKGRSREIQYLDAKGRRAANRRGVAGRRYVYDGKNMTEATYFDLKETPVPNHFGWQKCIDTYDGNGNNTVSVFYDAQGNRCLSQDGIDEYRAEYDSRGYMIKISFFDAAGKPCLCRYGHAATVYEYDAQGNVVKESYYGTDGKLCLTDDWIAVIESRYDEQGRLIRQEFFGTDGKSLCLHKDGYAAFSREYDERGNIVKVSHYGTDGKLCLSNEQIAVIESRYDEQGRLVRRAFFGADGRTPCLHKDGNAAFSSEYDERGNIVKVSYYGTDGKLCLTDDWIAVIESRYDEQGRLVRRAYFGTDGKTPCLHKDGYAAYSLEYDARGKIVKLSCYGVNGKLCLNSNQFAIEESQYDDKGRLIRWDYFGTDGKTPCLHKHGYAAVSCEYDAKNALIGRYLFDADKKPFHIFCMTNFTIVNSQGWHAGVRKGDVIMRWGDWENSPGEPPWNTLPQVVMRSRSLPKTVVFARKEVNGQWSFFKCSFSAGLIGISFGPLGLAKEEAEALLQAYAEWKRIDFFRQPMLGASGSP